ncbi:MAG: carbohydrate ABC transporter permease [Lachnospiraceae bacterium]|nr:carbohydrate ABC transporter permease [Lachnospiraceae bacterium]
MKRKQTLSSLFLTVIGLFLALVFFSPILILLSNSFKSLKDIYLDVLALPNADTFIASNYPDAFEKLEFVKSFANSLVITVCSTVLILIFCSMAAWVLVRYKTRTSSVIFMLFASATLIPFQCVMLPLVRLMDKMHMMNRQGLILMYLGFGASLSIILFHGFIKNVPVELEDAARIDGCNMVQTFFLIVLPMLKTIMVTVAILNVMWIWNDFLLPQLMINKPGWQTLPLKTFLFFGQFSKKWDLATAGLIMCMLPIILFYIICQKHIVKGVTEGAVKG